MFLDHFIWGGGGGDTPLVLRKWWDAVNQYLRRGERVGGRLLLLREGWEVVIEVNATDWWSIYWIIQLFFRLTILLPKFFSWAVTLDWAFVMRMRNTGPKHWTSTVIEDMANSRFWSFSLCMDSISLVELSIFLLSLILSDDRDHKISGAWPLISNIEFTCAITILTFAPLL